MQLMPVTRQQLLKLKALITKEPYASMANDEERKATLEAKAILTTFPVPIEEVQRVLMESGEFWTIQNAAGTSNWASMTMDLLSARFETLTVFSPGAQAALDGLEEDSLLSSTTREAIEAMATKFESVAEKEGLGSKVRIGWFDRARAL